MSRLYSYYFTSYGRGGKQAILRGESTENTVDATEKDTLTGSILLSENRECEERLPPLHEGLILVVSTYDSFSIYTKKNQLP